MATFRTTIYKCDRCGLEIREEEFEDGIVADGWKTINYSDKEADVYYEDNDIDLCPDCAKQFITWFDNFIGYDNCSNCAKSERLPSGGYACLAERYDIVTKTCFVPKKEVLD